MYRVSLKSQLASSTKLQIRTERKSFREEEGVGLGLHKPSKDSNPGSPTPGLCFTELRVLSSLRHNSAQWGTHPQWERSLPKRQKWVSKSLVPPAQSPFQTEPQPCPVLCGYSTTIGVGVGVEPAAPWAKLRSPPPFSSSHPLGHSATCEQSPSPAPFPHHLMSR